MAALDITRKEAQFLKRLIEVAETDKTVGYIVHRDTKFKVKVQSLHKKITKVAKYV